MMAKTASETENFKAVADFFDVSVAEVEDWKKQGAPFDPRQSLPDFEQLGEWKNRADFGGSETVTPETAAADSADVSEKRALETQKLQRENEKLRVETAKLRVETTQIGRKWWKKPSHIGPLLGAAAPIVLATVGWFQWLDTESHKATLNAITAETSKLEAGKKQLELEKKMIGIENETLMARMDQAKKYQTAIESIGYSQGVVHLAINGGQLEYSIYFEFYEGNPDQPIGLGEVVPHLRELLNLRTIKIDANIYQVSAHVVAELAQIKTITNLSIIGEHFDAKGLQHLVRAQSLHVLVLQEIRLGAENAAFLGQLVQIESLDLSYASEVGNAEVQKLKGLRNLQTLVLTETDVGNEGLRFISRLRDLEMLGLSGTRVSDNGLLYLTEMKRLTFVDLSDTDVTPESVAKLKRALPKVQIIHSLEQSS
jgi:hypothetical protein